ncbi:hypothetical protein BpHYR1_010353 [Brachionus plicatilis]|uniref:Uncharacterized protein n=1 Tax=Brachionus plicatilis TaxID=10195 RepID=A0A3M7QCU2_BRAPC|nr:hypothetical protein BpHYR1_010353 [Brachionus plicatilis]
MQFCVPHNFKTQKSNQYNSSIGTKFLLEKESATKLSLYDRIIERIDAIEKDFNQNIHKPFKYDHVPISSEDSTCSDQNLNVPFSLVEFYPYRSNKFLTKNKQSSKIYSAEQLVQKEEDKKLSTQTKCLPNITKSAAETGDNAVLKRPESSFSSSTSKYFTACTFSTKSNSTKSKIKNQEVSVKSEQNLDTEKEKRIHTLNKKSFKISSSWTLSDDSDIIEKRRNEIKSLLAMKNFLVPKFDTNNSIEPNNIIIKTESHESSRASIQINGLMTSKKFKTENIPKSRSEEHEPFSSKANDLLN